MNDLDLSRWTHRLLDLLHTSPGPIPHRAAYLLQHFAGPGECDALEAVLLDRTRESWVRVYLLRSLVARRLVLRPETIAALVTELCDALGPGAPPRTPEYSFADEHQIPDLARLADAAGCRAAMEPILRLLDQASARALVERCSEPADGWLRDQAYQRVLELGALDRWLAARTFDRVESRAYVLDASELDAGAITTATAGLDPDEVERAFAGRPAALAHAIEHLALPVEQLVASTPADGLKRIALDALADADEAIRRGQPPVRIGTAARVLGALPQGVRALDRVIGDAAIGDRVRRACVAVRVELAPAPDFAALSPEAIAGVLHFADRPSPDHRALLVWALGCDEPAFRYAALRGLAVLDGGLPREVVRPLCTSSVPLLRSFALGAVAHDDPGAVEALVEEAARAPDVVRRAHALRGLRRLPGRSDAYTELFVRALAHDHEVFDRYYAPTTIEAALGLAHHPGVPREPALAALVQAGLGLRNDDTSWAIDEAIRSWVDGGEVAEGSLFLCVYWPYLYPGHRNDRQR